MDSQSLAASRGRLRVLALTMASLTYFNLDIPAFSYGKTLLTSEAIAAYVFRSVARRVPADLVRARVRIMEDPSLYGDCTTLY